MIKEPLIKDKNEESYNNLESKQNKPKIDIKKKRILKMGFFFFLLYIPNESIQGLMISIFTFYGEPLLGQLCILAKLSTFVLFQFFITAKVYQMSPKKYLNLLFAASACLLSFLPLSAYLFSYCLSGGNDSNDQTFMCSESQLYPFSIILSCFAGIGSSFLWLMKDMYQGAQGRTDQRARFNSLFCAINSFSAVSGYILSFILIKYYGLEIFLIVNVIISFLACIPFYFLKFKDKKYKSKFLQPFEKEDLIKEQSQSQQIIPAIQEPQKDYVDSKTIIFSCVIDEQMEKIQQEQEIQTVLNPVEYSQYNTQNNPHVLVENNQNYIGWKDVVRFVVKRPIGRQLIPTYILFGFLQSFFQQYGSFLSQYIQHNTKYANIISPKGESFGLFFILLIITALSRFATTLTIGYLFDKLRNDPFKKKMISTIGLYFVFLFIIFSVFAIKYQYQYFHVLSCICFGICFAGIQTVKTPIRTLSFVGQKEIVQLAGFSADWSTVFLARALMLILCIFLMSNYIYYIYCVMAIMTMISLYCLYTYRFENGQKLIEQKEIKKSFKQRKDSLRIQKSTSKTWDY